MATSTDTSAEEARKTAKTNGKTTSKTLRISDQIGSKNFWRSGAPKGIATSDPMANWQRHLSKRQTPRPLDVLTTASDSPLQWGVDLQELSPQTVELLALAGQFCEKKRKGKSSARAETVEQVLGGWLETAHKAPPTLDFGIDCLVIANLLPSIAEHILPEFWWDLADAVYGIACGAQTWHSDPELPAEQGVAQQMLAGELPLTLAYFFPEIRPLSKLRNCAHESLTEGITELTNGNGLLRGGYLDLQRPLVAIWTRCRLMGEHFKKGCWGRKTDEQFQWTVTHSLALSSPTGSPLLVNKHQGTWTADFLHAMIAVAGDKSDVEAAKSIFGKKLAAGIKLESDGTVPETSTSCEWAGVAYMRTEWERRAQLLAIDYSSRDLRLECWSGTQQLFSGTWTWETTLNGKRLEPVGTWEEACWFSDEDVDYLELSIDLAGNAVLERQILLARDEMFLLLCDYVIDTAGGKVCHRYRLPLCEGVEFEGEQETREGLLRAGKAVGRVLPLALPEWRSDPRVGQLTSNNSRLQLEQEREGKSLACPLLIDLDRSRAKKHCTWRQLTVAQSLEIQPHDVAVGYRAQCGKDQWLIYRSLAEAANRTVLGQNLSNECLVARFLAPEGEVDELLEIE